MLKETGRQLLILKGIENSISFWNRVCLSPEGGLLRRVMRENRSGLVGNGWYQNFADMLQKTSGLDITISESDDLLPLDKRYIMACVQDKILEVNNRVHDSIDHHIRGASGSAVRACPNHVRIGFKTFKYQQWFQDLKDVPIISYVHEISDIRILAKFRCGMHWLATETQRSNGVGRSRRICKYCNDGEREDELHIFFCGAYSHIRDMFACVFESELYQRLKIAFSQNSDDMDYCMNKFVNSEDTFHINALVGYLRKSIKVRENFMNDLS